MNASYKADSNNRNELNNVLTTSGKKRLATSGQVARSVPRQFTGYGKTNLNGSQAQKLSTTFQSDFLQLKPNQISIYSKM